MQEKLEYTQPKLVEYGDIASLTRHHRDWHDPKGKVGVGPDAFTQKSLDEELGS